MSKTIYNQLSVSRENREQKYFTYRLACSENKAKHLKITVNGKKIETPLFIPGHSFRGKNGNPSFWKKTEVGSLLFQGIDVQALMVNAYDLGQAMNGASIHELLDFQGVVYIDSGGYQYLSKNHVPDIEKIMSIQEKSNADIVIPLDRPIPRKPTEEQVSLSIGFSLKNNLVWMEKFGDKVLPVIHGITIHHLQKQMEELSEPKKIGIGSLVPQFMYTSRKRTIQLISEFVDLYPDIYIHAFGVSYSLASILFLIGVDSVDSTSWIHNSRFGSIRPPHKGPHSVALRSKSVPRHKELSREEWEALSCKCPVCSYPDKNMVWQMLQSWKSVGLRARAIHNVFINIELANEIRSKICSHSLKNYIKDVISQTSLSYLLKDEDLRKKVFGLK